MWVKGEYFDQFDAAALAARGLLDRDAQPEMFDRLAWFRATWAHIAPGISPLIVRAVSEKAQAWLFFARQADGSLTALSSWYTLAFCPVYSGAPDDVVKLRLLTAIAKRMRHPAMKIGCIALRPVPVEDGTAALIAKAFVRAGWGATRSPATVNWIADLTDKDFETYWAERPGQVRSTVGRKGPKTQMEITIFDRFDEPAWADYEAVYATSWKPEEGSPAFVRAMAESEGSAGTLRLGIGKIAGEAVAAQLWTVENGKAIIHKLAYAEAATELSPGTLLSHAMFKRAIEQDQVTMIDYGTGDDGYKAGWMDRARPLEQISLFNLRRASGLIGYARERLSGLVRRAPVD
ncbi:hypothetical protein FHS49_003429 [Sphingobium boeckii]|uniref:BioF2-like acetyltransferase domain-containing protein n=1 Tax=Sphingobium boeckii TaxID=1082345 RepID=A0A7W9AKY6_9SPHN|nr:hypothetical protein [Sphingobium boeckii]